MSDITIRLVFNKESGKKDIWIDFESDDDMLPIEHEQRHRQVIEQLLGKGILQPDEVGDVHVQRGKTRLPDSSPETTPEAQPREPQKVSESS